MDGLRDQWTAAGHDWSTEVPAPARSEYVLAEQSAFFSPKEGVQEMIGEPDRVILDTRSKAEFDGKCFWPSGATEESGRAGHIPGAVHIPVELLRADNGIFRSKDEMLRAMQDCGIEPETEIVTYCTIGNRASQAWYALTFLLGYPNVRVYYGSWTEWGTAPDTLIES